MCATSRPHAATSALLQQARSTESSSDVESADCAAALLQYALKYEPQWIETDEYPDGKFPHLPMPPEAIEECLRSTLEQDRELAIQCAGLMTLKLHCYYMGHFRQPYDIRASRLFRGDTDSPFTSIFIEAAGITEFEFVSSGSAVRWATSIQSGPLAAEIAATLEEYRRIEAWVEEYYRAEKAQRENSQAADATPAACIGD